jgi:hypothetical protein
MDLKSASITLMGLGDLTRQLAKQAISDQVKDVVDSLGGPAAAPHPGPDNPCATMLAQLQAMQKATKEDEELAVLCTAGDETLRVLEIFAPSWQVLVLTGVDADRNVTRVISPVHSLQLICKVMKLVPPAKATRVRVITPRSKSE